MTKKEKRPGKPKKIAAPSASKASVVKRAAAPKTAVPTKKASAAVKAGAKKRGGATTKADSPRQAEAAKKVVVHSRERVLDGFIKVDAATVQSERFDGAMAEPFRFLVVERGDSAAALVHDLDRDVIILAEQFRFPTHDKGPGWLIEPPAGSIGEDEDAAACMRREILEEIGYEAKELTPVARVYASPGGSSERIFLFYAPVRGADLVAPQANGVATERENISRRELSPDDLFRLLDQGAIEDAKLMILAQWLRLNKIRAVFPSS